MIVRSSVALGGLTGFQRIPNPGPAAWLTVWNTQSSWIRVGVDGELVGPLRKQSFYVGDEDPIELAFVGTGQTLPANTPVLGAEPVTYDDRPITYGQSDEPLYPDPQPIYPNPVLLQNGVARANSNVVITPYPGEVFTHLETAWQNANLGPPGDEGTESVSVDMSSLGSAPSNVPQGIIVPPVGNSRQVNEIYGPFLVRIHLNSPTLARCDWQLFGAGNVRR